MADFSSEVTRRFDRPSGSGGQSTSARTPSIEYHLGTLLKKRRDQDSQTPEFSQLRLPPFLPACHESPLSPLPQESPDEVTPSQSPGCTFEAGSTPMKPGRLVVLSEEGSGPFTSDFFGEKFL